MKISDIRSQLVYRDTAPHRAINSIKYLFIHHNAVQAPAEYNSIELYKKGADYVLTPHFLGGEYLAKMLTEMKTDKEGYKKEREKHIKMLTKRFKKGQEHPEVKKN